MHQLLALIFIFRGEVMNGGFGLVLDGSEEAGKKAKLMLNWDVSNGVSIFMCTLCMYTLIILLHI